MRTAVEWLETRAEEREQKNPNESAYWHFRELIKDFEQAKAMEKKYINDAHCHGYDYCRLRELDEQDNDLEFDYFQITFKQQEQ